MADTPAHEVLVCNGPECGGRRFSADVAARFRFRIKARGLGDLVKLGSYRCFGRCQSGPNVLTRPVGPGPAPPVVVTAPGARLHLGVAPGDVEGILDGLVGSSAGTTAEAPAGSGSACTTAPFAR